MIQKKKLERIDQWRFGLSIAFWVLMTNTILASTVATILLSEDKMEGTTFLEIAIVCAIASGLSGAVHWLLDRAWNRLSDKLRDEHNTHQHSEEL